MLIGFICTRPGDPASMSLEAQAGALLASEPKLASGRIVEGGRDPRSALWGVVSMLTERDRVFVCRLDRLGETVADVSRVIERIWFHGSILTVLAPPMVTAGVIDAMVLSRGAARMDRAKLKRDRPTRIDWTQVRAMARGGMSGAQIAREMGCTRRHVVRILMTRAPS